MEWENGSMGNGVTHYPPPTCPPTLSLWNVGRLEIIIITNHHHHQNHHRVGVRGKGAFFNILYKYKYINRYINNNYYFISIFKASHWNQINSQ